MKCFAMTTLFWGFIASLTYAYIISTQTLIIPNQLGYMQVSNDAVATATSYEVNARENALENLIKEVTK